MEYPPIEELYDFISTIGSGSYGQVYKARDKKTGEIVALKQIFITKKSEGFPRAALREICPLRVIGDDCPNTIILRKVLTMNAKRNVYLVFDYCEYDLSDVIRMTPSLLSIQQVKSYLRQILIGLRTIHCAGYLHRDIKPNNLLLSSNNVIKITDFGLSRSYQGVNERKFTSRIATLWYRPPELLLGSTKYGAEVDVWSLGCTFYEMLTGTPLFQGNSEVDVFNSIIEVLGTPDSCGWSNWRNLPNASIFLNHRIPPSSLSASLSTTIVKSKLPPESTTEIQTSTISASNSTVSSNLASITTGNVEERCFNRCLPEKFKDAKILLLKMLDLDPQKRISIQDAFLDPYLSSMCNEYAPENLPPLQLEESVKKGAGIKPILKHVNNINNNNNFKNNFNDGFIGANGNENEGYYSKIDRNNKMNQKNINYTNSSSLGRHNLKPPPVLPPLIM